MKKCGIYKILNTIDNKVYIGQSVNTKTRLITHRNKLRYNKHDNEHLQNAWNKHGPEVFHYSTIEECDKGLLNERESYWIEYYNSLDNKYGYNKMMPATYEYKDNKRNKEDRKDRKIQTRQIICLNINTLEILEFNSLVDIRTNTEFDIKKVMDVLRYWKIGENKQTRKSYKGFVFIDKDLYNNIEVIDIIKQATEKKEYNRKEAAKKMLITKGLEQKVEKAPIPYEERKLHRKAVILENKETGELLEYRSIKEAVIALKLVFSKVYKVMHSEYKKYSHKGFYIKYK